MKKLTRFIFLQILFIFVFLSTSWTPALKRCHKINAKAEGVVIFQHRESIATEADIIGGGLLNGTTRASFILTSFGSFTGFLQITTKHGKLDFRIYDGYASETEFRATAVAMEGSGTGKLRGATGVLYLEGVTINANGDFTENITGEICLD
ncbi:hypothetical protein [Rufibacter tibetensis]|uniref:DUF3224 domain-containing protein n=1 Tax=Rufibacter tibetensis TaxID=512763 RepID=A0A0P0D1X0_9BACT|nr:hypothetical protein [Rufibacter tibetensis]ALJ00880.1 hypothetical protein DC20_20175 [Rufibacter tibetensis]